jgi:hypothetical protein
MVTPSDSTDSAGQGFSKAPPKIPARNLRGMLLATHSRGAMLHYIGAALFGDQRRQREMLTPIPIAVGGPTSQIRSSQ